MRLFVLLAWPALLAPGLASAASAPADASAVPALDGHVTDPGHRLKSSDKEALESKVDKLMNDTHCDLASWIADVPVDTAPAMGRAAFEQWHIGRDWQNGVLFVFPSAGRVHVTVREDAPAITPAEVTKIEQGDDPRSPLRARIERAVDEATSVLLPEAKVPKRRPPGQADPQMGARYAVLAGLVACAAVALSVRRRRRISVCLPPTR